MTSILTERQLDRAEEELRNKEAAITKAQGAIEQLDRDLLENYGLKSHEEAQAEVEKLTQQLQALDRRAETESDIVLSALSAVGIRL